MNIDDRERLVRVEEGVKNISKDVSTLRKIVETNMKGNVTDKLETAKNLAILNTKVGMISMIFGLIGGVAAHFMRK